MPKIVTPHQKPVILKSELAGENPVYIYWSQDRSFAAYSSSITDLTEAPFIKSFEIDSYGLSFLLQNGAVPPPKTVYKNLFILGIGDTAEITSNNGLIEITFHNDFPFSSQKRPERPYIPDTSVALELIANATLKRTHHNKPTFLFHSAGKDSNTIALALAEAGWQDKVTLITHHSKSNPKESHISAEIAKKLGFRHRNLEEYSDLNPQVQKEFFEFFREAPFPCTDGVSLAYPLYAFQYPQLKSANIIDGMGNDVYIGHMPSHSEYQKQRLSRYFSHFSPLNDYLNSENRIRAIGRTRCEWIGLSGFSFSDTSRILPGAINTTSYWKKADFGEEYTDLRGRIRGTILDQEVFTRKIRNFTDVYRSNLILPWATQEVAEHFWNMDKSYLFDKDNLKNKTFLRKLLSEKAGIDSDGIGKLGFKFSFSEITRRNWNHISEEIMRCRLWDTSNIAQLSKRLKAYADANPKREDIPLRLIYKLYLISIWANNSKLLNP